MPAFTFISPGSVTPILACLLFWLCLSNLVSGEEISHFKSRPDLYPPVFTVEVGITEKLSPGYIFIGPYEAENPGPYIYDNDGELVWSGWGSSGPGNAHGMHVCKYNGEAHLCFFQGNQQKGYCRGHGVIMDNQYRIVRSVQPGGGMASSDMHEFMPINDGKTALMTVYQQRQFDMTPWNIMTGVGWLMESIFQEVDVETDQVLFEWRSLDHVDPSLSYTYPDHTDTSGDGLDPHTPWDYFHINSIQKNADGDYLISSRHTCAVYKISHRDGSIIWTLHGQNPSFRNINFSFSQQHDARWLSENSTHTLLSIYNNGYNGFNQTHSYSSGMIILIDHVEMTATQLHDYGPPGNDMISSSQGNMQVLPDGNVVMGWGNHAYVSEHDAEGNLLLWGYFAQEKVMNYRAQKFEWDGNPTDSPAMWTFSKEAETHSPTTFYVSWNGATRVKSWRFYGSQNITGPYTFIQEVNKTGFETEYTDPLFYVWSRVEAVDAQGKSLGKSRNKFTFVPSPELREFCAYEYCGNAAGFGLPGDDAAEAMVPPAGINTVPWIDPEHPYLWPELPESYYEEASHGYGRAYKYVLWAIPIFGAIAAAIGGFFLIRWYRRRRRYDRVQRRGSHEALHRDAAKEMVQDEMWLDRSGLPWWNWRRWRRTDERPHYFALTERRGSHEYVE